jgi:putative flippase GtrA
LDFTLALFFSTVLGVFFNFITVGKFVFNKNVNSSLIKFILVYVFLYFFNILGVIILNDLGFGYKLSGFLMIAPSALVGFILNQKFVFKKL